MTTPILTEADVLDMRAAHGWAKETIRAVESAVLAKLAAMNEPVAAVRVERGMLGGARRREGMASLADGDYDVYTHPPAAQDREDALRKLRTDVAAMYKDESRGDIVLRCGFNGALTGVLRLIDAAMKGTP